MIELDLAKQLGGFDVDVRFTANARVTALFGRSGAGKTSVVNMIAGLTRPDRGRVAIDGRVLFDSASGVDVAVHARRIGYVFQEARLFPHLTVRHNLLYGHRSTANGAKLHDIVALLGLEHVLERRPGDLSGGEKQRVAIGRALLSDPQILLLDEPLASLDAHRKNEVLQYIELMRDEVRVPMIYVSHAVDEVVRLADWVVLMSQGRVAASGEVEDVMGRPDLRGTTGIFEGGTVIDAKVVEQDLEDELAVVAFDGGTLTITNLDALIGEAVRVRIRARDVSIALEEPRAISIQNVLRGKIDDMSTARSGVIDVSIAIGAARLRSRVTKRAADRLALARGMPVFALIKAVSLDRQGGG